MHIAPSVNPQQQQSKLQSETSRVAQSEKGGKALDRISPVANTGNATPVSAAPFFSPSVDLMPTPRLKMESEEFAAKTKEAPASHVVTTTAVRDVLRNLPAFSREAADAVVKLWTDGRYLNDGEAPMGKISETQMRQAQAIVYKEMSAFIDSFGDYAPIQEVDAETQAALVEAGLCSAQQAPTFLNANSNSDWSNLAKPSGKIRGRLIELFGYEPNDALRGKAKHTLIGHFVRVLFETKRDDNVGAVVLKGYEKPVVLFRSGTLVGSDTPKSSLKNLINKGNVSNVVNLYAGHFPLHDLIAQEAEICGTMDVGHHNERLANPPRQWRKLLDDEQTFEANKEKAMNIVSHVIKDILMPQNEVPKGNILVHCGGGMHRTGMIVGIIRRYCNNDSMEDIVADYKRHVAWRSKDDQGGYEDLNIRFIKEFDLSVLEKVLDQAGEDAPDPALGSDGQDEWGYFSDK
ncbi:MAG: tyrosine-protein phosphatase [Myxococcota bacterium]|nr:tyrosine-protein phosphatase [Myxococcota bacterium]